MGYLSGALAILLALALLAAGFYRDDAGHWKNEYQALQTSFKTAALAAQTHAKAVEAADQQKLNTQGHQAITSAATHTQAAQVHYKTVYLPSLTKLDPKDEASKCASFPVPDAVINSLSASGG